MVWTWTDLECIIGIICPTVATLRPIIKIYFPLLLGTNSRSAGYSHHAGGPNRMSNGMDLENATGTGGKSSHGKSSHGKSSAGTRNGDNMLMTIGGGEYKRHGANSTLPSTGITRKTNVSVAISHGHSNKTGKPMGVTGMYPLDSMESLDHDDASSTAESSLNDHIDHPRGPDELYAKKAGGGILAIGGPDPEHEREFGCGASIVGGIADIGERRGSKEKITSPTAGSSERNSVHAEKEGRRSRNSGGAGVTALAYALGSRTSTRIESDAEGGSGLQGPSAAHAHPHRGVLGRFSGHGGEHGKPI